MKPKTQKIVVRKGGLVENLYLQKDGSWGDLKTARRFSSQDAAMKFYRRFHKSDDFGLFPAADAPQTGAKPRNSLAAHGFSEKAEKDLDTGTDKLRKAFNDSSVKDVQLTRDEAGAIFLRMAQLESGLFVATVKAK